MVAGTPHWTFFPTETNKYTLYWCYWCCRNPDTSPAPSPEPLGGCKWNQWHLQVLLTALYILYYLLSASNTLLQNSVPIDSRFGIRCLFGGSLHPPYSPPAGRWAGTRGCQSGKNISFRNQTTYKIFLKSLVLIPRSDESVCSDQIILTKTQ